MLNSRLTLASLLPAGLLEDAHRSTPEYDFIAVINQEIANGAKYYVQHDECVNRVYMIEEIDGHVMSIVSTDHEGFRQNVKVWFSHTKDICDCQRDPDAKWSICQALQSRIEELIDAQYTQRKETKLKKMMDTLDKHIAAIEKAKNELDVKVGRRYLLESGMIIHVLKLHPDHSSGVPMVAGVVVSDDDDNVNYLMVPQYHIEKEIEA